MRYRRTVSFFLDAMDDTPKIPLYSFSYFVTFTASSTLNN